MLDTSHKKDFLINLFYIAAIVFLCYLGFKYLLPVCLPFIISFILAAIVRNIIKKHENSSFYKNHKVVSVSILVIIYTAALFIVISIVSLLASVLSGLAAKLPAIYKDYVQPVISNPIEFSFRFPEEVRVFIQTVLESIPGQIGEYVKSFSGWLISLASSLLKTAPTVFVNIIITLISSFFIVLDYDIIIEQIKVRIPTKAKEQIRSIWNYLTSVLWVVIKSYAKIMLFTFLELVVALAILRVKGFAGYALIIAFLDILPILGTGTVLIPWGIISVIGGNTVFGLGLLASYIIITVIRNVIEPKLVGGSLGLHPVLSLISMFIGLRLIGVLGMFGFPIAISYYLYMVDQQKKKASTETIKQ